MKFTQYFATSIIFLVFLISKINSEEQPARELHGNNISCNMTKSHLDSFLQSGGIKGYFTATQFWFYFNILQEKYSNYIGHKVPLGHTYLGNTIHGFYFGQHINNHEIDNHQKNIVFITGLHHSREPLTVTMVLYLMIRILNESGACHEVDEGIKAKWELFFRNNVIFFIPIVNLDSYKYIAQNWRGQHAQEVLMIRKNRNISPVCTEFTGGVDLNRNYSFMFGLNESGSSGNPCEEDFRGSHPFSEPETLTIKNFVENHPNIVTGINMHTYGNAWIFPFNFVHDSGNHLLEKKKPKFYKFYKEFVADMKHKHEKADYGNAQKTVQYPTNGEAGDWMTEEHNIINLDVELGNLDKRSDQFYPPKSIIPNIVSYNFKVFRQFFWKHNIDLELHQVKRNLRKKTLTFIIFNQSISTLYNFKADVYPIFKSKKIKKSRHLQDITIKNDFLNNNTTSNTNEEKRKIENKQERILSSKEVYHINFATKADSKLRASDFQQAENHKISGTLKGRYFLEIEFVFSNEKDLHNFESLDLDMHYGNKYVKKYHFLTHYLKRGKVFKRSRRKAYSMFGTKFGIMEERKLKVENLQKNEQEFESRHGGRGMPKLMV